MDVLIAILCTLPAGIALGILIELRYGPKLSAENQAAHVAITQAATAITEAANTLKGA